MRFDNACDCIVDYEVLEKAIIEECNRRNVIPKENYKIYLYRGYAGISIKHDKVSVHRLIGKYMVGFDLPSDISVHHIDGNKMNNDISNLQVIRKDLHTKQHYIVQYVSKEYMKGYGRRMREKVRRNDVTYEEVKRLRTKGLTIPEIASRLNCGYNTVCRRLAAKNE